AVKMIRDVLKETGVTATAGIGTNMYLAKIAMDIVAKKMPADKDGVRVAELDEMSYRKQLWNHRPLTSFWRIGHGYASKLEEKGLYTMGDIARCSLGGKYDFYNEDLLYKLFGINAELLIDHAWGYEPCTIEDIKSYRPENNSISTGQVLQCPYNFEKGKLIVREMTDLLTLDLVDKELVTDQMVLTVGYDIENLKDTSKLAAYSGQVTTDHYGRQIPKSAHGSINLGQHTSSTRIITEKVMELYDRIVDPQLTVRRMYVVANHVINENNIEEPQAEQLDFFTDYEALEIQKAEETEKLYREKNVQRALLGIKKKYGKNAVLKGMNLEEGATTIERNGQVGGHKA
ncbi:MAG: DNA methylase, partial [Ruminiclostridium sp.]|nr:DNA methylase [Ruminiclostridium sp.]